LPLAFASLQVSPDLGDSEFATSRLTQSVEAEGIPKYLIAHRSISLQIGLTKTIDTAFPRPPADCLESQRQWRDFLLQF
jgi:hypothetical protein